MIIFRYHASKQSRERFCPEWFPAGLDQSKPHLGFDSFTQVSTCLQQGKDILSKQNGPKKPVVSRGHFKFTPQKKRGVKKAPVNPSDLLTFGHS